MKNKNMVKCFTFKTLKEAGMVFKCYKDQGKDARLYLKTLEKGPEKYLVVVHNVRV